MLLRISMAFNVLLTLSVLVIIIELSFYFRKNAYHDLMYYDHVNLSYSDCSSVSYLFAGDSRALDWYRAAGGEEEGNINISAPGIRTDQVLALLNRYSLPCDDVPNVVFQAGINDLKYIVFFPTKADEIVDQAYNNIVNSLSSRALSGKKVILTSVLARGELPLWRKPLWPAKVDQAVASLNQRLSTLSMPNITYVDINSVLVNSQGIIKNQFQKDTLHINKSAYRELSKLIFKLKVSDKESTNRQVSLPPPQTKL